MKKLLVLMTVLCIPVSLCGCSVTSTTTDTSTSTDANGNSTTTTTTTTESNGSSTTTTTTTTENSDGTTTTTTTTDEYPEGSCGALAEDGQTHTVDVSIENATGGNLTGIYMCKTGNTEWDNLLDEDEYLGDGSTAEDYITITYALDSLSYDMGVEDENGDMHEFDGIDISDLDPEGFTITFTKADDGYHWTIDEEYVK